MGGGGSRYLSQQMIQYSFSFFFSATLWMVELKITWRKKITELRNKFIHNEPPLQSPIERKKN